MGASPLSGIDGLMKLFGPLVMGSGTQTTRGMADPTAINAQQGLANQATANANNAETNTADIVSRIIQKNAIAFAPVAAAQKSAGMYNSRTLQQLAGEAQAASSAEASRAVLDYRNQQMQIASGANASILGATRGQQVKTPPMISPAITGAAGAGLLGYSAYKNWGKIKGIFGDSASESARKAGTAIPSETPQEILDVIGSGGDVAGEISEVVMSSGESIVAETAGSIAQAAGDLGMTASDASDAFDIATQFSSTAADAIGVVDAADSIDAITAGVDAFDTVDFFSGAGDAIEAGTDIASAASGISDAADLLGAFDFGPSPLSIASSAMRLADGDIGGAVLSFIPGGNLIADAIGSIICTELYRQKRLSREDRMLSLRHFAKYKQVSRAAYYIWATPSVAHLRAHPNSWYSNFLETLFKQRSNFLSGKRSLLATAAYSVVSATSIFCGLTILPFRNLKRRFYLYKIGVAAHV